MDEDTKPVKSILVHPPVVDANLMVELVHVALGAASVCWDPMDCTGVFQEDVARQIGSELMGVINEYARHYPPPELVDTDDTMQKVYRALRGVGWTDKSIINAVHSMQNEGIYFREAKKDGG